MVFLHREIGCRALTAYLPKLMQNKDFPVARYLWNTALAAVCPNEIALIVAKEAG